MSDGFSAGGGPADEDPTFWDGLLRAWRAFSSWRRSRPFWGGLLIILGAGEILLSERAPLPLVIHIGFQGLAGYLVPAILLLCGLLLWFNPVQRTFYSLLAVLLALGSWITSNLGGFFVGMLLGLVGGALAFGWARSGEPGPTWQLPWKPRTREPSEGLDLILGDSPADPTGTDTQESPQDAGVRNGPSDSGQQGHQDRSAARPGARTTRALPACPAALVMLAAFAHPALLNDLARAAPGAVSIAALDSALTPAETLTPGGASILLSASSPSPKTGTSAPPAAKPSVQQPTATAGAAPVLYSLTAGSMSLTGLSFDGVRGVPTASGDVPMLEFGMSSMTLSHGIGLTLVLGGQSQLTRASSLGLSGHIVLYTTRISGTLNGVPVVFTPRHLPPRLSSDVTLTNVTAAQLYASGDLFDTSGLETTHASGG